MIEFFSSLLSNFFSYKTFSLTSKQAKSEAISTIKNALRLTHKHIRDTRAGEFGEVDFSDKDSDELVDAWSKAATAIRPFNPGIASTFESKSDYWSNPSGFRKDIQNGQRRFDYRFRLGEVEKELAIIESNF